jgi:NAD(P)-dependent dehydrogenase (short-subunit alcohol dehydrogenase family)
MISLISGGRGLIGSAVSNHLSGSCIPYDMPEGYPPGKEYDAFIDCARYPYPCDQEAVWEHVIKHFKSNGEGRIILFSSIYGHKAPDFSIYPGTEIPESPLEYAMQKGAIEQATRYLAQKLKPYNIQVNAISPGGVLDNHTRMFQLKYVHAGGVPMIKTKNILPVIDMLLHPDNAVNGQVITVDGGWSL